MAESQEIELELPEEEVDIHGADVIQESAQDVNFSAEGETSNEDELNFRIKRGIGEHSGIKFPDGKILRMDRCFSKAKVDQEKLFEKEPKTFRAYCTKFDAEIYAKNNPDSEFVVRSPYTKLHFPKD